MKLYLPPGMDQNTCCAHEYFISSLTVQTQGSHDVVRIFSRGALSGIVMVAAGEGPLIAQRLGLQARSCPRCGHPHDDEAHTKEPN